MEKNQKSLYEAQNDAALQIIKVIRSEVRDIELINALSSLLTVTERHPVVSKEVDLLVLDLLEECKEEADSQLIEATANLIKAMKY